MGNFIFVVVILIMLKLSIEDICTQKVSRAEMWIVLLLTALYSVMEFFYGNRTFSMQILLLFPGIILLFVGKIHRELCGLGDGIAFLSMGFLLNAEEYLCGAVVLGIISIVTSLTMIIFCKVEWKRKIAYIPFVFIGIVTGGIVKVFL